MWALRDNRPQHFVPGARTTMTRMDPTLEPPYLIIKPFTTEDDFYRLAALACLKGILG